MAGDLIQKLNMTAQRPMQIQKPAQNQPAATQVQTPIKEKGLEYLPAVTITPPNLEPTGIKPHSPAGRLIKENIFQSAVSTVKNYGNCAKYFYDAAFKGEGTDYSVGKINDLTVRAGSLGIAGILAATKAFPFAKGMEFVGLATWFGSMALWPRIIGIPIKAKTGVDINWKYEDSYGRRKPFLQDPQYLAWDLLSQAEHDEMASSILITPCEKLAKEVALKIEECLQTLPRKEITAKSINERGAIIITKDINEAISLMNEIAPEHLELLVENPLEVLPKIKHAGAIFIGENTPEPIGDYIAGPNHTLPTGGSAKFFSPLGVEHFMKKSSIISFSKQGIIELGRECGILAHTEGLDAHRNSVLARLEDKNKE